MDPAARAQWALSVAFSRDDVGFTDWNHAAAVLGAACALPGARGLESRALEQALELAAERFSRMPRRAPLPEVQGETHATFPELLGYTTAAVRHGGLATTFVALAQRTCELAGREPNALERARLARVVRSVLAVKELDRYLGGLREPLPGLSDDPTVALQQLELEALQQLEGIQPDQVYRGARIAFVSETIHGVIHAAAVRHAVRLTPSIARAAVGRLAEQLHAQRTLVEVRAPLQFEDLQGPSSLDYLEVLGQGFDDPEKLLFACAARELWDAHGRPEAWELLIGRTLAALE